MADEEDDDDAVEGGGMMDDDADADCGGAREAALAETWRGMRRAFRSADSDKQKGRIIQKKELIQTETK